jgi:hypothetical protein
MRTLAQVRQFNCTRHHTPVGLGEGAHAACQCKSERLAAANSSGGRGIPVGLTVRMAVPKAERFSTVEGCTGLTSDERIPFLETDNCSMTSVPARSTFAATDRIDGRRCVGKRSQPLIASARPS